MRILITGGAGLIGSHLIAYHLAKGDKVWAIDDLSATDSLDNVRPFLCEDRFEFFEEDILIWPFLERIITQSDRIYHMAAVCGVTRVLVEPIKTLIDNFHGVERILKAISFSQQLTIASTSEVYAMKSELEFNCMRWNYALSKLAADGLALAFVREFGFNIISGRIFSTIGSGQDAERAVVPRFIQQAIKGDPITVYGNGQQTRCFCDVRDTVRALDMLAGNKKCQGEMFNIGNDCEISIRDLAFMIKRLTGSKSPIIYIPYEKAYVEGFEEKQENRPDLNKLFEFIGFEHEWRLEDTLQQLIEGELN